MAVSSIERPTGITYVLDSMTDTNDLFDSLDVGDIVLVSLTTAFSNTLSGENRRGAGIAYKPSTTVFDITFRSSMHLIIMVRIENGAVTSVKRTVLTDSTNNLFIVKRYTKQIEIAANDAATGTGNDFGVSTPSGYEPIGIKYYASTNSRAVITRISPASVGTGTFLTCRNVTNNALNPTFTVDVVYAPASMVTLPT